MSPILKFHIDNEFFIKLEPIKELRGVKVSIPERRIYQDFIVKPTWKLYESQSNLLTIYKNGIKIKELNYKEFTHRPLIELDILHTCKKYNIYDNLVLLDNNKFGLQNIYKIINIEAKQEKEFIEFIKKIKSNKEYNHILEKYNLHKEKETIQEIIEIGGY